MLLLFQLISVTFKTKTIVTTNNTSTGGTTPFFLFSSEELFQSVLFDRGEVFKKAHMEKR